MAENPTRHLPMDQRRRSVRSAAASASSRLKSQRTRDSRGNEFVLAELEGDIEEKAAECLENGFHISLLEKQNDIMFWIWRTMNAGLLGAGQRAEAKVSMSLREWLILTGCEGRTPYGKRIDKFLINFGEHSEADDCNFGESKLSCASFLASTTLSGLGEWAERMSIP